MKTATLLIFLAVVTVSGDTGFPRTAGEINGRAWRGFSPAEKLVYLVGLGDGIRLIPGHDDKAQRSNIYLCDTAPGCFKSFFGQSTNGEIIDALNDFYRDPANVQIGVGSAMIYFQTKVDGGSLEDLARDLASLRKIAADLQ